MIERRPFNELGGEDRAWLKAKHHFSFGEYADAARMGWGSLRVWNDDDRRRQYYSDRGFRDRNGRRALGQAGCATPIEEKVMSKVLVLYYSSCGHIEAMANAVAEGARQAGAHVDVKRVPELVPEEIGRKSHYKYDQPAPIAKVEDLAAYDAIIIGAGTRFGRLSSQMANFLDQAGGLWLRGALHGKVGGAFTSTATQHGGQETTLFSIITNLLHFGMVVVGLDYGHAGHLDLRDRRGLIVLVV
jgi:NAD(P)H dehydrogenase (quinone)